MRGLPEEAFATYDKQAKKAPVVDEMFEEFGDKALVSATAVLLWRREMKPAGRPERAADGVRGPGGDQAHIRNSCGCAALPARWCAMAARPPWSMRRIGSSAR